MRIGIDFRILSAGPDIVHRGMGRYTQQQLREVLKLDSENEYVLFCRPNADRSLFLPEIRTAPNVSVTSIVTSDDDPNQPSRLLSASEEFQEQIYGHKLDIFHVPTLFLWHDIVLPQFDVCPLVVTFYDLIPLIFSSHYLPPKSAVSELYTRALIFTLDAVRLIAISAASRQDAINYLGFPPDEIDIAYPIADPSFQVLPSEQVEAALRKLHRRVELPNEYVMTVTHLHHSKNLDTLLAAYALLPPSRRRQLPLVIACHLSEAERAYIGGVADTHGIAENVVMTGFVTEDELVALYNAATMVVHPSRYEGFGLPVLEALKCGTPVVTTTSSSLPEVGGDAAILVDPDDKQGFADAIDTLYLDPARREAMRKRGLEHAKKFDPAQLGRNTLESYQKTHQSIMRSDPAQERPRIALWTPLPPQKSGVADYSAELLRKLSCLYDIEVFVDDGYLPSLDLLSRYVIHHYRGFERRQAQDPFDVILYQVGASAYHLYMYGPIQKWPGIVILHDLVWGYALYASYAQSQRLKDFKRELMLTEGQKVVLEFSEIEQLPVESFGPALESFLNRHYMLKRIVDSSLVTVVHMDEAQRELADRYHDARVYTIHMGVDDPWQGLPVANLDFVRAQLGIQASTFVVGVFGSIDPVKHLDVCIKAFGLLSANHPDALLIIVGDAFDPRYMDQLLELTQSMGLAERVRFVGHIAVSDPGNDRLFDRYLLTCDVVVNLRYPSRKQMSGTLLRAVAAGKPVLITDLPEWSFLPNDFCWKIQAGDGAVHELGQYLVNLATDPVSRRQMSVSARAYFEQCATVADMAAMYESVIDQVAGRRLSRSSRSIQEDRLHMRALNFNKVCELEDFSDAELVDIMRDVFRHEIRHFTPEFPKGAEYRKYWEIAMSVRALRYFGVLRRDALILGVGAGTETTGFYLTNQVGQVFVTDLYLDSGTWENFAPGFMLAEPEKVAPYDFERDRLVVQHMDGRVLRFPDNTFDGIFSSGSIEHFGGLGFIANSAYEMGRVLKPGGMLTLSTEYLISGPPGGIGWEGCVLFSRENLTRYIVEASGLELVDDLNTDLSDATLTSKRDLTMYIEESDAYMARQGRYPRAGEIVWSKYPHLVLVHQGYVFCSVHLTLRKPDSYPAAPNEWARPTEATRTAISRSNLIVHSLKDNGSHPQTTAPAEVAVTMSRVDNQSELRALLQSADEIRLRGWNNPRLRRMPKWLGALGRVLVRIFTLGRILETQAQLVNGVVNHHLALNNRVASLSNQLTELEHQVQQITNEVLPESREHAERQSKFDMQLAQMTTQLARLEQEIGQLRRIESEISTLSQALDQQAASVARMATQFDQVDGRIRDVERIESEISTLSQALDERTRLVVSPDLFEEKLLQIQAHMESRIRDVDEKTRLNTSYVRLLIGQYNAGAGMDEMRSALPLMKEDLLDLLHQLEHQYPELARCGSVELSVQDGAAEEMVAAGAAYFGDRMSSAGEVYRSPNDAWYHVDFTPDWKRSILFESARARLKRGGKFVLVTGPGNLDVPKPSNLDLVVDHIVALASARAVRVYVWQKT